MEEYRAIVDFSNYEVSNHGNVRNKTNNKLFKFSPDKDGYLRANLTNENGKKTKRLHQLVANAFLENILNKQFVDHKDGNVVNNHVNNLRWCSNRENSWNQPTTRSNTSGIKGVHYIKQSKKWQATMRINGIKTNLGIFKNIEDAKLARMKKATEIFGEFVHDSEKLPPIKLKSTVKLFELIDDLLNEINQLIHL